MIALLVLLTFAANPSPDTALLSRLAKAYDYRGLRSMRLEANTGSFSFGGGTGLNLSVSSAYDLFPKDSAKYWVTDSQFTRKVLPEAKTDEGKVPGLLDFASLFLQPGVEMRLDSAQKGRVKVSLPDIHNAWFALGHVPVIPFLEVSAELDVDTRTLEISQLRAAVHTPGGLPERETYVLQFGQFRTVQGRLIPGLVQYSIAGLSHSMNDRSMEFVQQGSHSNRAYRDSIVRKVENLERSGQKELASKYKRAAVRVRSLKAQIADEVVTSGKPFEVKLLKVVEGNQKAKKKP